MFAGPEGQGWRLAGGVSHRLAHQRTSAPAGAADFVNGAPATKPITPSANAADNTRTANFTLSTAGHSPLTLRLTVTTQ